MSEVSLELPWPPSVNDYKVPVPKARGRYFLTKRAKKFRDDVATLCIGVPSFPAESEILLDIVLHPPDRRRRDADNFNKAIWDALEHGGVFKDDCQVQSYRVSKGSVVKGGMVCVRIWERESC